MRFELIFVSGVLHQFVFVGQHRIPGGPTRSESFPLSEADRTVLGQQLFAWNTQTASAPQSRCIAGVPRSTSLRDARSHRPTQS